MTRTKIDTQRRSLEARLRLGDPAFAGYLARIKLRGGSVHFFTIRADQDPGSALRYANVSVCRQLTMGASSAALGAPLKTFVGNFCKRCLDEIAPVTF